MFVHTVCGGPSQASFCKSNMTPLYVYFTCLFNMMKCTNKWLDWFVYAVDTSLLFRPRLSLCCREPTSRFVTCGISVSINININQNVIYVSYCSCSYILLFVSSTKQHPSLKKGRIIYWLFTKMKRGHCFSEVFAKNETLHGGRFYYCEQLS